MSHKDSVLHKRPPCRPWQALVRLCGWVEVTGTTGILTMENGKPFSPEHWFPSQAEGLFILRSLTASSLHILPITLLLTVRHRRSWIVCDFMHRTRGDLPPPLWPHAVHLSASFLSL